MNKDGTAVSACPFDWEYLRYTNQQGSDKMNEYITTVFNVVYLLLAIALVDRLIELFRNLKK